MGVRLVVLAGLVTGLAVLSAAADEKKDAKDAAKPAQPEEYKTYALKLPDGDPAREVLIPGAKVDVVLIEKTKDPKLKTSTVVQDILVIAIGGETPPNRKKEKAGADETVVTVTLAVKEKDIEKLAEAQKKGEIRLTPRKPDEPKKR